MLAAGLLALLPALAARASESSGLERLLEAELSRLPARTGLYLKHLSTGVEAGVRADESFNSMSVIKIPILIRAYQLRDQGLLSLDERIEIRREMIRDGTGIFQYHDPGASPTLRDLLTEMIITSDNTATEVAVEKVGGIEALNRWLADSGYAESRMVQKGVEYRAKLLALADSRLAGLAAHEVTGLMYALSDNTLFAAYAPFFAGPKAELAEIVKSPGFRERYRWQARERVSNDRAFWLGAMTARETGRLLEAIELGTAASTESCRQMRDILKRQQLGVRRIAHFLDVPVGHKTGDYPPAIANDVGLVYARSGPIVMAFFTSGNTGPYARLEDQMGELARLVVQYFDGRN